MFELSNASAMGHLRIRERGTKEYLVDKQNAIHFANLSATIAKALVGADEGHIKYMCFGNGGSSITPSGTIFYRSPNTSSVYDETADLYNQTWVKNLRPINDQEGDPLKNKIEVPLLSNSTYTDIVMTCVLDFGEPQAQNLLDNSLDVNGTYVFDEIGIKSNDVDGNPSLLLAHILFSPVEKSANRVIEIEYTIRIQMG